MADPKIVLAEDAIEILPEPAKRLVRAGAAPCAVPMDRLSCPVYLGALPAENLDQIVYQDPGQIWVKLYLPRYRLATFPDERGTTRRQIRLRRGPQLVITAELEPYPAPELGDAGREALPATGMAAENLQLEITRSERLEKRFGFQRIEHRAGRVYATLTLTTEADKLDFEELLRDTGVRFRMSVARKIDVAAPEKVTEVEAFQKEIRKLDAEIASLERQMSGSGSGSGGKITLRPTNLKGQLEDCQRRQREYSGRLLFAANMCLVRKVTLSPQEPLRFLATDLVLDLPIWNGLIAQITTEGHRYFQNSQQPSQFYYLPDRFDLGPKTDVPNPKIRANRDGDRFQLEYRAFPRVDKQGRLMKDGRGELLAMAGAGVTSVELLPLKPDPLRDTAVTYTLRVPEDKDLEWADLPRPGSCRDLHHRINDSFEVGPLALKRIYDAMFGTNATLFTGQIEVKLGDWRHRVDFQGRVATTDRETLWDEIFEDAARDFIQTIHVQAPASVFTGDVNAVRVEFRLGKELVELTRDRLTGEGKLRTRIADFVLDRPGDAQYEYRLHVVRGPNTTTRDWQSGREDRLHIRL